MQNWREIASQGYQAIFDTEDGDEIIIQQEGPFAETYDAMTPSGAVSSGLKSDQVEHILQEFGARACSQGNDNQ
jgi:hypothetical protein